nr:FAD-dependent oxidoreductase [Coraliomargarita parva]
MGAGLAGCLLAWQLKTCGLKVLLIGDSTGPTATQAAAGLINPVTGRWMTKSWRVDSLFPVADKTYAALETQFGQPLFHPVSARRFFQNGEDYRRAGRRSRNPRYADVLGPVDAAGTIATPGIADPFGSIEIRRAAWVDLPKLIGLIRADFAAHDSYLDTRFDYDALHRSDAGWNYKGIQVSRIIFCEGTGIRANPWFQHLPLKPIKGETLALTCPSLNLGTGIYHSTKWLLAYGDGRFRLGATYDEADLSDRPTDAARNDLLNDAAGFIDPKYAFRVAAQFTGHRPSTPDTHPLVGTHPTESGLYLFNGLGSKGASVAPWLSQHFVDHLLHGMPLDPEVDLQRFL